MEKTTDFSAAELAAGATLISTVMGFRFYEHPIHGDETTMLAVREGSVFDTPFWETPTVEELADEL